MKLLSPFYNLRKRRRGRRKKKRRRERERERESDFVLSFENHEPLSFVNSS